jgi:hypothetical protein
MYSWAAQEPEYSHECVASVPFVRERMFDQVEQDYREHGMAGMLYGPSSGIPYKVYAVLAPPLHQPVAFYLLSIPARLERFALSWIAFTALGSIFKRWIRTLFLIFWIITYASYWSRI